MSDQEKSVRERFKRETQKDAHERTHQKNIRKHLNEKQKLANRLELDPSVESVKWAAGQNEIRYWVTFQQPSIPEDFHSLYGLKFDSAWLVWKAYHIWEYVLRKSRMRARYTVSKDAI